MCGIVECTLGKSYNYNGLKPKYCSIHKLDGMINTRHEVCIDCNKQASFGLESNNLRLKCSDHKTDDMINLKHKNIKCLDELCIIKKNCINGYCSLKCKLSNISHELVCKTDLMNISNKEHLLFRFLQTKFMKVYWDKQIKGTLFRPDFRINFNTFQILIELDEEQHKKYDKNNEIKRIDDIYNALNIPVYVIRFNPDRYIVGYNKDVVKSCFSGDLCVNTTEWDCRLDKLMFTINECINKSVCEKYEIIYLFYDDV